MNRQYIESDATFSRRFQTINISEPSVKNSVHMLRGLKNKYEIHHGLKITDAALLKACSLSARYITDRFLPDKAIDLVDEAAARLRIQQESKPELIENMESELAL